MQSGDHQLTLESSCEHLVGIPELRERPFQNVNRLDPTEQRRVGLGDLESELRTLTR